MPTTGQLGRVESYFNNIVLGTGSPVAAGGGDVSITIGSIAGIQVLSDTAYLSLDALASISISSIGSIYEASVIISAQSGLSFICGFITNDYIIVSNHENTIQRKKEKIPP